MDEDDKDLLVRVDERLKSVQEEVHNVRTRFDNYVLHVEFKPVQLITFGMAALILCTVLAAIVASVVH